ncbi:hypothetical protein [Caballeronia sp. Lep1P3]|uniref:hypothetical protein n=1 Tax=Caballeronia sp. Lep1P3 TaxID=2878150 RepID=UPI001FD1C6F0|nr:hypothetical protein [Caballeronia sp. Lep1P3]
MSITQDQIEIARQKLLEAIYNELPDDRFRGREALTQLLNTLVAARQKGMSFERMAEILQKEADWHISVHTLRQYFFDLKTDAELAAESLRHAKKVAATRKALVTQTVAIRTAHGDAIAVRRAKVARSAPRLINILEHETAMPSTGTPVVPKAESGRAERPLPRRESPRPASPAAPVPPPTAAASEPARVGSERGMPETAVEEKPSTALPTSEKSHRAAPDVQSEGARTLAQIEEVSLATDERTELLEDVELREGDMVYYVSGKPFKGFLAFRQIHLLRTVGRLIAPTKGRTSKDFVKMPVNL